MFMILSCSRLREFTNDKSLLLMFSYNYFPRKTTSSGVVFLWFFTQFKGFFGVSIVYTYKLSGY